MATAIMKSALMIAYHFPPVQVSSGLQRTLANVSYLPDHGWQPLVLSAHPRAYPVTSQGQMKDIPKDTVVSRAFSLDTARHLRVGGAYPEVLALPDRWISWWLGAIPAGRSLIKRENPSVIWSTYPIATAHLIALTLHKLSGLPWVADFRDSMTEPNYPTNPRKRRIYQWIERKTITHCSHAVFTTDGAVRMYQERYPDQPNAKWVVIPNGYNEEIFAEVERTINPEPVGNEARGPVVLLHSGVIYPDERDPRPFFDAIASLSNAGKIDETRLRIVLRASGHEQLFAPMLAERKIDHLVKLEPSIPYREALAETLQADGLLVLQASSCNHQIPAKIYEYFRAGRPVLALTDPAGDTAASLRHAGITAIARLDDRDAIAHALQQFVELVESGCATGASSEAVRRHSRAYGAETLAGLFNTLTGTE